MINLTPVSCLFPIHNQLAWALAVTHIRSTAKEGTVKLCCFMVP